MMDLILKYGTSYLIVHVVIALIGLSIELINKRYLKVSCFAWAFSFGPFYFISVVSDLNRIVIDLRSEKK